MIKISDVFPQSALLTVSLIFGANYWITKNLMPNYFDPFQLLLIRTSGAFVLIWTISIFVQKEKIENYDIIKIAACSILGIAFNQGFLYIGLNKTSPFDASIIHTSNPILVLFLSYLIIKEKICFNKALGMFFGFSGALLLIISGAKIDNSKLSSTFGNIFILANSISYALYLIFIKDIMVKYKPVTVLKWLFLFGLIFSLPFFCMSDNEFKFQNIGTSQWISIFYIIILNSFLAYLLMAYALKKVTATIAGYYTYIQPFVVAAIGILIGKETPTLIKVFCGLLIFFGVYLINLKRSNLTK